MIFTLPITILIEGCVVVAYSALRRRPAGDLLRASLAVNVLTQIMLWAALKVFYRQYLITLVVAEVLIWLVEGVLIYFFVRKRLSLLEAMLLSFSMNALSFGVGWFLPV